jgi:hypothetical protein
MLLPEPQMSNHVPSPHDEIRLALRRWSDALQRHIDIPAYVLWPMACLAYEVDLTVPT